METNELSRESIFAAGKALDANFDQLYSSCENLNGFLVQYPKMIYVIFFFNIQTMPVIIYCSLRCQVVTSLDPVRPNLSI